jgi:hypothetical protein
VEKLNEKGEVTGKEGSGIKEGRLKALRGNYIKPDISEFVSQNDVAGDCSDMASSCTAGGGDPGLTCGCGKFDVQP